MDLDSHPCSHMNNIFKLVNILSSQCQEFSFSFNLSTWIFIFFFVQEQAVLHSHTLQNMICANMLDISSKGSFSVDSKVLCVLLCIVQTTTRASES